MARRIIQYLNIQFNIQFNIHMSICHSRHRHVTVMSYSQYSINIQSQDLCLMPYASYQLKCKLGSTSHGCCEGEGHRSRTHTPFPLLDTTHPPSYAPQSKRPPSTCSPQTSSNYQKKNCAYTHQSLHSKLTHHSLTYHSAMKCNQSIH